MIIDDKNMLNNRNNLSNQHHHNHTKSEPTETNQSTLQSIIHQNITITNQPHKSEPPSLRISTHPYTTMHHPIINATKIQTPISPETHA